MEDNNGSKAADPSPHESQSTQIMNFALGMAVVPSQDGQSSGGRQPSNNSVTAENGASKNGSGGESLLSDASNASVLARYHFHGLANTQTQTQHADGDFDADDHPITESQKENTPTHIVQSGPQAQIQGQQPTRGVSNTSKQALCEANGQQDDLTVTPRADESDVLSSEPRPSDKASQVVLVPDSSSLSLPRAQDKAPQTKAVAFISPAAREATTASTSTKAQPRMRLRSRRSPSPDSQDSFAGPSALQDPDLFLATSKQFVKPLSELGSPELVETQSQESKVVAVDSPLDGRTGKAGAGGGVTQMTPYSLSSTSSRPLALGRVLVVNSDDSSGPSQDSANSGHGSNAFEDNQFSQQPTQINASLNAESDTSVATQIDEVATQIVDESSQPEPEPTNPDPSNILPPSLALPQQPPVFQRENPAPVEIPATATHGSVASITSSMVSLPPRSIFGLASAQRLQRYMDAGMIHDQRPTPGSLASPASLPRPGPIRAVASRQPPPLQPVPSTSSVSLPSANTDASTRAVAGTPVVRKTTLPSATTGNNINASSGIQESEEQVEAALTTPSFENIAIPTQKGARKAGALSKIAAMKAKPAKGEDVVDETVMTPDSSVPLASYAKPRQGGLSDPIDVIDSSVEEVVREQVEQESDVETDGRPLRKGQKGKAAKVDKVTTTAATKGKGKGKGVAVQARKAPRGAQTKSRTVPEEEGDLGEPKEQAVERGSSARPPKSMNEQRAEQVVASTPTVAKGKGKAKQEPAGNVTRSATRSARGRRAVRGYHKSSPLVRSTPRTKRPEPQTPIEQIGMQVDNEEEEGGEDSPDVPLAAGKEVDVATEVDGSEVHEDDDEYAQIGPGPSKKRKRAPSTLEQPKSVRATRTATARSSVLSLGGPPQKRAKNHSCSKGLAPTRVFALWKNDKLYYAGTVIQVDKNCPTKFSVEFDDQYADVVDFKNMRRCELKVDDEVIIAQTKKVRCRVSDASEWVLRGMCQAVVLNDDNDEIELNSSEVAVSAKAILAQWNDRTLELADIVPRIGRKPFSRIGFAITLGPQNTVWETEKNRLVKTIKDNGGAVFGDWSDIFTLQGRHENNNKRWVMTKDELVYKPVEDVESVFLLADVHNQKPRYLIALALGIPCVSIKWLDARVRQPDLDWYNFLLPAGFSDHLDARITQLVNLDWGNSKAHLTDIPGNKVPHKVLSGCSVLCLGAELVPLPPQKKGGAEVESSRTVPCIILAMGASRVEAVGDARNAFFSLPEYDYVVVKDLPPKPCASKTRYVTVTWIKECLIAGRLLPIEDL